MMQSEDNTLHLRIGCADRRLNETRKPQKGERGQSTETCPREASNSLGFGSLCLEKGIVLRRSTELVFMLESNSDCIEAHFHQNKVSQEGAGLTTHTHRHTCLGEHHTSTLLGLIWPLSREQS